MRHHLDCLLAFHPRSVLPISCSEVRITPIQCFRGHPKCVGHSILARARFLPYDSPSCDVISRDQLQPATKGLFVRKRAQIWPQLRQDNLRCHHIDSVNRCQVYSEYAMQLCTQVELRLILGVLPTPTMFCGDFLRRYALGRPGPAARQFRQSYLQLHIAGRELFLMKVILFQNLSQFENYLLPPVALQATSDLLFTGPDSLITHLCQLITIPFPFHNSPHNSHSRHSAEVADDVRQLHVHGGERLLRLLYRLASLLNYTGSLPPKRTYSPNFSRGPERIPQQSIRVQLHQPLAFLDITFSSRQVFRPACVHQINFQTLLFQHFLQCDPVHPGGLNRYSLNPAGLQPLPHPV